MYFVLRAFVRNSIEHNEKKVTGSGKTGKSYLIYGFLMNLFCYPLIVLVPLCISGADVLLPAGRWWMHPARVHLAMLPAVNPWDFDGLLDHIKMKKHVKAIMAEKISDMGGK
jgi:hypothetical protein